MSFATKSGMGVKRLEELVAYQLAVEFKMRVYALVRGQSGGLQGPSIPLTVV